MYDKRLLKYPEEGRNLHADYLGLATIPILIEDTSPMSDYFHVSPIFSEMSNGKYSFIVNPDPNLLKLTSQIKAELVMDEPDFNGNIVSIPIVFPKTMEDIIDYTPGNIQFTENVSSDGYSVNTTTGRDVQVIIYEDIPSGMATLTLVGEAIRYYNGATVNIPTDWTGVYNVRWSTKIRINTLGNSINAAPIVFYKSPVSVITEFTASYKGVDAVFPSGIFVNSASTNFVSLTSNAQSVGQNEYAGTAYTLEPNIYYLHASGFTFDSNFVGASVVVQEPVNINDNNNFGVMSLNTMEIATPGIMTDSVNVLTRFPDKYPTLFTYRGIVTRVVNSSTAVITPYVKHYINSDEKPFDLKFYTFENSHVSMSYYHPEVRIPHLKTVSYLNFDLSNLKTLGGQVSKVRVSYRSAGTNGEFTSLAERNITNQNLLVDNKGIDVGRFPSSISDTMTIFSTGSYTTLSDTVLPTAVNDLNIQLSSDVSFNSVKFNASGSVLSNDFVFYKITHKKQMTFYKGTEYQISIDLIGQRFETSGQPIFEVYMSGSGFLEGNNAEGLQHSFSTLGKNTDNIFGKELISKKLYPAPSALVWRAAQSKKDKTGKVTVTPAGYYTEPNGDQTLINLAVGLNGVYEKDFSTLTYKFTPDFDGTGNLVFVIQDMADWIVNNITVTSMPLKGFSPAEYTLIVPNPSSKRSDTLEFKIEFLNPANSFSSTWLSSIKSLYTLSNNVVIEGDDNFIHDGSLVIGGSSITENLPYGLTPGTDYRYGVELAGGPWGGYLRSLPYSGYTSATAGNTAPGFLIYSGSPTLTNRLSSSDNYNAIGLELNAGLNYGRMRFRADGTASIFEVVAQSFFVGDLGSQYISGADGKIEISSSNFFLSSSGDAYYNGIINALGGNIGGFHIGSSSLWSGQLFISGSPSEAWAGYPSPANMFISTSRFNVKSNGDITGSNILMTGGIIKYGTISDTVDWGILHTSNIWDKTQTFYGGNISSTTSSVTTTDIPLFAGTHAGLYRSFDGGANWAVTNTPMAPWVNGILGASGSWLFAGTTNNVYYTSSDYGNTWKLSPDFPTLSSIILTNLVTNGPDIYLGVRIPPLANPTAYYKSTDGGKTWNGFQLGISNVYNYDMMISSSVIFIANGFSSGGVVTSSNNGSTFHEVTSGFLFSGVRSLAYSGPTLFAGTLGDGIYTSSNGGRSWGAANNGMPPTTLNISCLKFVGTTVYAGIYNVNGGVYKSTDMGATWTACNNGLTDYTITTLNVTSDNNLYVGTENQGVFYSVNGGASWTQQINGLNNRNITNITSFPPITTTTTTTTAGSAGAAINVYGNAYVYKTSDTTTSAASYLFMGVNPLTNMSQLYSSIDNGVSLQVATGSGTTAITSSYIAALGRNGSTLYAGGSGPGAINTGVAVSTDFGLHWTSSTAGLPNVEVRALKALGSKLFVGTYSLGMYSSSITNIPTQLIFTQSRNGMAASQINAICSTPDGATLLAGTSVGVYISSDYGITWAVANNGLTNTNIQSVYANSTRLFAGAVYPSAGVFVSDNGGASWAASNTGLYSHFSGYPTVGGFDEFDGYIFIATGQDYTRALYRSTDNGATWTNCATAGYVNYGVCVSHIGSRLFYGGEQGMLYSDDYGTTLTAPITDARSVRAFLTISSSASDTGGNLYVDRVVYAGVAGGEGETGNSIQWNAAVTSSAILSSYTASYATTGSNTFRGNQVITGSLRINGGVTGSLLGTASFVSTASFAFSVVSASFAATSSTSYLFNGMLSSSFAVTSSNIFRGTQVISGSVISTGSIILTGSLYVTGGMLLNNSGLSDSGIPLGSVLTFQKTVTAAAGITTTSSIIDNGNGTITVVSGSSRLYTNKNHSGFMQRYTMPPITTLSLTNSATNYVIVDYNSGNPIYRVTTDVEEITESDIFPVYTIFRDNLTLYWVDWDSLGRGLPNKLHQRLVKTQRYARESGLIVSTTGSYVTVTEGKVWLGVVRHTLLEILPNTEKIYTYYHSASAWTHVTGSTFNSSSYDNGITTASLSNNNYNTHWVYRHIQSGPTSSIYNNACVLLGTLNANKLSDAQAAQPPSSIPPGIASMGILVGRIIVQEGVSTAIQVDSAFDIHFSATGVTAHSDLTNLDYASSGHTGFLSAVSTSSMLVLSSSYALSASWAPGGSSISASYALTASYALNGGSGGAGFPGSSYTATFLSSSWGLASPYYTQSFVHNLNSKELLISLWDSSSGYYEQVGVDTIRQTSPTTVDILVSEIPDGRFTGEIVVSTGAGLVVSASYAATASILLGLAESASYAVSASWAPTIDTSVFATTGSNIFVGNEIISGSLNVAGKGYFVSDTFPPLRVQRANTAGNSETGTLTLRAHTNNTMVNGFGSSMTFTLQSGSTENFIGSIGTFRNGVDNNGFMRFGVATAGVFSYPMRVYGDIVQVTGSLNVAAGITGSLLGTSSYAIMAQSASYYTMNEVTKDPTGFVNPTSIIVTYSGSRQIVLTGTVVAYWQGQVIQELVSGWTSSIHDTTEGTWFLSYDGASYTWSQTPWTFDKLQIAVVRYSSTDKFALREVHGLMQWQVHEAIHTTVGTYLSSGADVSGLTLNSVTPSLRRPTMSIATIKDEDLATNLTALSGSYTLFYLTGSGVNGTGSFQTESAEFVPVSGISATYNQYTGTVWQRTTLPNNAYATIWLVAVPVTSDTESQKYRYVWFHGQTQSTTLSTIQALTPSSLNTTAISTMIPEFVFVARVIIRETGANDWSVIQTDKLLGSRYSQTTVSAGNYLSAVVTDATLSGDGSLGNPLSVVSASFFVKSDQTGSFATLTSNAFSGNQAIAGSLIISKSVIGSTVSMSAVDVDWSLGNTFTRKLTQHSTLTFSNTSSGQTLNVILTNSASAFTASWPATITWKGGTVPTQTTASATTSKTDIYTFICVGSLTYGASAQNF